MSRVWAIAANTFREAIRDRVLYSILFFAVLVLFTSLVMGDISIGDTHKVVRSVALGAIAVFGSIISIFLGIGLVYKEIERKTIYTIASKPLPRWMFIVGKYAGLMMVIGVQLLAMTLLYTVLMTSQQGVPPAQVYIAMGLLYLELGLLTAWALLFSTYSGPNLAAAFSLAVFVIGHLADDVWLFGKQASSEVTRQAAAVLYWILPNFEMFNILDLAIHDLPVPMNQVWGAVAYGGGYTAAVLAVAVAIFSSRDFK